MSVLVITNGDISSLSDLFELIDSQTSNVSREVIVAFEAHAEQVDHTKLGRDIVWIPVQPGQGIGFNRNKAWEAAKGELVAFVDDDCTPGPTWLEDLLIRLEQPQSDGSVPDVVLGGTRVIARTFLGRAISGLGFPAGGSIGFRQMFPVSEDGSTDYLSVGNCVMRRQVLDGLGGFDETLTKGGEDTDLGIRLRKADFTIVHEPKAEIEHAPRESLRGFVRWQVRRGRAKKQIARRHPITGMVGMRLKSTFVILKHSFKQGTWLLVPILLFVSNASQAWGYLLESRSPQK